MNFFSALDGMKDIIRQHLLAEAIVASGAVVSNTSLVMLPVATSSNNNNIAFAVYMNYIYNRDEKGQTSAYIFIFGKEDDGYKCIEKVSLSTLRLYFDNIVSVKIGNDRNKLMLTTNIDNKFHINIMTKDNNVWATEVTIMTADDYVKHKPRISDFDIDSDNSLERQQELAKAKPTKLFKGDEICSAIAEDMLEYLDPCFKDGVLITSTFTYSNDQHFLVAACQFGATVGKEREQIRSINYAYVLKQVSSDKHVIHARVPLDVFAKNAEEAVILSVCDEPVCFTVQSMIDGNASPSYRFTKISNCWTVYKIRS